MEKVQVDPAVLAAESYEKSIVTPTMAPFAAILLDQVRPRPGEHILDVACGTGVVARLAAPLMGDGGRVVGVDINPAMLAVARKLSAPIERAIEWREGSALALPLENETFDLAYCQHGLQFFADRPAALREIARVLRPNGRIALAVWRSLEHNPVPRLIWESVSCHLNAPVSALVPSFNLGDAGELQALLEAAGYVDVAVSTHDHTVREPHNPQLISQILAGAAAFLPAVAAMKSDEREAVAASIQQAISPELEQFMDGDEQVYTRSAHIAQARKG